MGFRVALATTWVAVAIAGFALAAGTGIDLIGWQ